MRPEAFSIAPLKYGNEAIPPQLAKLATLGTVCSALLHELSQPLNTIKLICGMLLRDIEQSRFDVESAKEELPEIAEQVNCIEEIMSALSLVSRTGNREECYERIDINKVLSKTLKILAQQLKERNINIFLELCPDQASNQISGSMAYLVLLFVNLIINARDAVESSKTPEKAIHIRTYRTNDSRVAIEVQDNGPGITDEIRPRIFEPYFTTKKKNGTGIGLAFSKRIVENHRGTMEIESEPGKGATFRVLLPLNLRRTSFPAAAERSS